MGLYSCKGKLLTVLFDCKIREMEASSCSPHFGGTPTRTCYSNVVPSCAQLRGRVSPCKVPKMYGLLKLKAANSGVLGFVPRRWETKAQLNLPLIAPTNHWGTWSILLTTGAFGIWSEKTKIGSALSGALVSTLVALAASNLGLVAHEASAYQVVNQYLLPLAVPLLLYTADLRRVIALTGRLLIAFCLGSVATVIGTLVAYLLVPMRSLGQDNWKIAAALMSRHIGGAVNYVAVSEALGVSSSVLTAGLAADNLVCALYFTTLFALASRIPPEISSTAEDNQMESKAGDSKGLPVLESATALALSCLICNAGMYLAKLVGFQGGGITCITALVVVLATAFPSYIGSLAPAGEALALIMMQVFFAVIGASGSIANVVKTAPAIFLFALVQVAVHLAVILGIGKILGFDPKLLLLASNANVGGPTTACGMATTKGWKTLIVPGILAGIFGISIATFLSIGFGVAVLKYM